MAEPKREQIGPAVCDDAGRQPPEERAPLAELSMAYQLSRAVGATLEIDRLIGTALRAAADMLAAQSCSLVLADRGTGRLIVDAAYGLDEEAARGDNARIGEGIAGYVLTHGEPLLINDSITDPRLAGLHFTPRPDIGSSLCVPVRVRESAEGVLSLNRTREAPPFTPADLELACHLAEQLSPYIERARVHGQTAVRLEEISQAARTADAIHASLELADVVRAAAEGLREAVGAANCRVYLIDEDGRRLRGVYSTRGSEEMEVLTVGRGLVGAVADRGEPLVIAGLESRPRILPANAEKLDPISYAALPLVAAGRVLGVVCLEAASTDGPGGEASSGLRLPEPALLRRLLDSAAGAIHNSLLHRRLRDNLYRVNILCQSIQKINASATVEGVLRAVADTLRRLAGAEEVRFVALSGEVQAPADLVAGVVPDALAGRAAQLGRPLPVAGSRSGLTRWLTQEFAAARLAIPLLGDQATLAIAVCLGDRGDAPSDDDILMTVGRHGAAALARAVAHQRALDRRALELSALSRLWERVGAAASFGAALEAVLDMLASIIEYEAALIFVWDGDRERLELHASAGRPLSREESRQVGEIGRWVVREQKAYLSAEGPSDGRPGSVMAAPLLLEGRSLGVLAAIAGPRVTFTREQMLTFSVVGSQAAAIYHAMQSLGRLTTATENILRSIAVGVIGVDESHRVLMWSPAAEQILGCPVARARGRNLEVVLEELARVHSSPGLTAITLLAQRAIARGEHSFGHQLNFAVDGAGVRSLSVDCAPLRTTHGEVAGAVVLVTDATERKQVEERMAQVSQLAAVGHLAANVAHEIRNPLSAIKAAAQFLQREYREDPTVHQFTGIINDETDRLTKVTTDFLLYARPSSAEPKETAVVEVLERGLRILGSDFERRGVRLDFRPQESLSLIPADAEELLQVFLNLGTNAAQAMEDGGVLTVSVGESDLARSGGGRALEVVFADTGPGVPEEYREQIFAPFFTTKTRGTGLGLSIVRKIVEGHGGEVLLDPSRGRGAVFRLRLPVSAGDVRVGAAGLLPASPGPPPDQLSLLDNATPVRLRP